MSDLKFAQRAQHHINDEDHRCSACGSWENTTVLSFPGYAAIPELLLCAPCGAALMIELYRELIVGKDLALMECLPVTVNHARVIWRERQLCKAVMQERERGLGISELVRMALWKVESAATLFVATVGRAASWR